MHERTTPRRVRGENGPSRRRTATAIRRLDPAASNTSPAFQSRGESTRPNRTCSGGIRRPLISGPAGIGPLNPRDATLKQAQSEQHQSTCARRGVASRGEHRRPDPRRSIPPHVVRPRSPPPPTDDGPESTTGPTAPVPPVVGPPRAPADGAGRPVMGEHTRRVLVSQRTLF